METNFSHEQSLALINEMIHRAWNNVQVERRYPVLFWGYTVAVAAVANFVLLQTLSNPNQSFFVWLMVIPAWVVSYFIDRQIDRTALRKTHIDKIGNMVWKGFGIASILFTGIITIFALRIKDFNIMLLINPAMMAMIGICEFASACIYRYKSWCWVAALFWAGAISCAFLPVDRQFVVLALCMVLGFVLPGHLCYRQQKQQKESHV